MSSLCGLFQRRGQLVLPDRLQCVSHAVSNVAPFVSSFRFRNIFFSGVYGSRDNLHVVLDGRFDNRNELIKCLELSEGTYSDGNLLLASYLKWGKRCPEFLVGDFAFCIYNSQQEELFCARDPFGVRPFYYCLNEHIFAFGSEIKALLCFPQVSGVINDQRIAEYLAAITTNTHSTFYNDILRLPPGYSLTVSRNGSALHRYYQFQPTPLHYSDDRSYAEHFCEIFEEAVACRTTDEHTGFLLSGGLDSSSIVCMANQQYRQQGRGEVEAYSGIFDTVSQCDERHYIELVLDQGNINWHPLHADELDIFAVLPHMARCQDEPWFAPHMFMLWNLLAMLQSDGVKVLLDGHDGDTTISHGWCHFNNLIQDGHLLSLFKEAQRANGVQNVNIWRNLLFSLYQQKIKKPLTQLPVLGSLVRGVRQKLRGSPSHSISDELSVLDPSLRKSLMMDEHIKQFSARHCQTSLVEEEDHLQEVFHPLQPFALEVLGRSVRHFGMEYHCPFWDQRVVEFCLNLPSEQKFKDGFSRSILRRGLAGILPDEVRLRPGKTDFTANICHSFARNNGRDLHEYLCQALPYVEKWVDSDVVSNYSYIHKKFSPSAISHVWKVVTLAAWVQTRDT